MRHKWTKGHWPNECVNCGMIRTKETIKYLMAITNKSPYNHYKYESRMVYMDVNKKYERVPNCLKHKT